MNLDNLNLVELNAQEIKETEGGILGAVLAFLGAVAWSAWENVGDIRDGWEDGKTGATRY
ncbi:bacteriocin [Flavobacterium sp. CAN_S2]|jgi:hypothetical protein|uniref:bacteriocin n=1 Tax=Flavobacterium sp. CAN_S2 TaxID=2787726 RepID=UPI0018CB1C8F